jgi:hypothetical protein
MSALSANGFGSLGHSRGVGARHSGGLSEARGGRLGRAWWIGEGGCGYGEVVKEVEEALQAVATS